jgi:hypothetical protein
MASSDFGRTKTERPHTTAADEDATAADASVTTDTAKTEKPNEDDKKVTPIQDEKSWLGQTNGQLGLAVAWVLSLLLLWILFGTSSRVGFWLGVVATLAYGARSIYAWSAQEKPFALRWLLGFFATLMIVCAILNVNPLDVRDTIEDKIVRSFYGESASMWTVVRNDIKWFYVFSKKGQPIVKWRKIARGALLRRTGTEKVVDGMTLVEVICSWGLGHIAAVTKDGVVSEKIWIEKDTLIIGDIQVSPGNYAVHTSDDGHRLEVFFYDHPTVLRLNDYIADGKDFFISGRSDGVSWQGIVDQNSRCEMLVGRLERDGAPVFHNTSDSNFNVIADPDPGPDKRHRSLSVRIL